MVSGGLFGDIVALTDSGRVFMSNVGINRFVEVHNIQSSPITPHTYFTLDHTSQLCYHTLRDSSITRYRIPRRALYVEESGDIQLYIELIGGNKVRLISFSQKNTFALGDVGKIFQLNEGRGSGRIAEVTQATISDKNSSVAILEVMEPFFKPKSVQNTIFIESHGDGLVKIGLVGGSLWTTRQIGSCILVLHCTPFLVSGVHSPTSLIATPLYPNKVSECMGSIESDRWFSINLDPYMSTVEVEIGDKFVVTEVGDQVTITAPSSLSSDLEGSIMTVEGGRQGIVQKVSDLTFVIISNDNFLLNEEFESGEIVFSNIGSGMLAEDMLARDSSWILSEPECEVVFVADDLQALSHPVPQQSVHIDTLNQVELKVKVSDKRMFPPSSPVFKIVFDNRDKFQFYSTHNTTSHLTQLTIGLSHESTEGGTYTPVLITPYLSASLKCEVPSVLFSVQQACDPQTRLVQRYPHVPDQAAFLSPHYMAPHGDNVMTSLPVNYRPPSIHGREISTSHNVYNADPSQPIPRSAKAVSKHSYEFKQCNNSDSRAECSCSDELKISDLAAHSDCRQIVYKVPYTSIFTPELLIMRLGEDPLPLNHTYLITELNGREEFQIYKAGENNLSPSCNYTNCSIVFLGSELFHYRVVVMEDTICNYSTEFLVYVVDVPLPKTLHNTITVHVGAIMFVIILIYYTFSKGADTDRSLNKKGSKFRDNSSSSSSLPDKTAPLKY
ncbi:cation channel sperm-associated auxiliary subunit beta-like isoform X3 [Bolinopsis microptera]|uniref:cation channel sperm-associated auxiliary subunit beta-like isoform X3 n=1 Tax=Bolinopsis microptera TaxID=2820187 RepID=UPI00307AC93F